MTNVSIPFGPGELVERFYRDRSDLRWTQPVWNFPAVHRAEGGLVDRVWLLCAKGRPLSPGGVRSWPGPAREGDRVGIQRNGKGELHLWVNGQDCGTAASGLPSRLWAVVDLYGKCTQVTVVSCEPPPEMDGEEDEEVEDEIVSTQAVSIMADACRSHDDRAGAIVLSAAGATTAMMNGSAEEGKPRLHSIEWWKGFQSSWVNNMLLVSIIYLTKTSKEDLKQLINCLFIFEKLEVMWCFETSRNMHSDSRKD